MSQDNDSILFSGNQLYIAELYERYQSNPGSVDSSWQKLFADLDSEDGTEEDNGNVTNELKGASWAPSEAGILGTDLEFASEMIGGDTPTADQFAAQIGQFAVSTSPQVSADRIRTATQDSIRALMVIRNYRVRGHLLADTDPLQLEGDKEHPELDPATYGFAETDMDREIYLNYVLGLETATMRQILDILHQTYCGHIGLEFMHIQDRDEKSWLQERIETIHNQTHFTERGKKAILGTLIETEGFEQFLDKKFTGTKRFGLDGGESLVASMEQIFKRGGQLGLEEVVLGMPHRGRLNVLANVMKKPFQAIFSEFQGGSSNPDNFGGSGDVKYHLGTSSDRVFGDDSIHLSLTANPSHLEAVNTVCLGKVRAKQHQKHDAERSKVMAMLLHGDAAFAGQGLVPEAMDLSQLLGYKTGGTIHIIVNNQIGFTTRPQYSRSSPYCSDVAKSVSAPIFHVNADSPEAVVHCSRIAIEYRQKFKKDVVIDMICYRRHGHNEGDEPMFTQPQMYTKIKSHPTTRELYTRQLIAEGVITQEENDAVIAKFNQELEDDFNASKNYKANKADWLEGAWDGLALAGSGVRRGKTGATQDHLKEIAKAITSYPDNFNVHRRVARQLEAKAKAFEAGEGIDWATAEALAFGSLLLEGHPVRLSGQDCGRGTFSQRHSRLVDQKTSERYTMLSNIRFGQAPFEVLDSPLSEAGVLGFEYGYSLAEPQMLVLWEGQFGDFANGAQVIIDQFISSGEHKWMRMCGLVMLLPHGFEGQGPEHSSARLERYLQQSAEDNWQVCNCTTPANYFHVLRRQMKRNFRKPLILMTPKSLLRHKLCTSSIEDFAEDSTFHRTLWDIGDVAPDKDIKRVVLCSGKVYYDLYEERERLGLKDVYIIRLEQLYPFPHDALVNDLARFPGAKIVWCQEEPRNMGSWNYILEPLEGVLEELDWADLRPIYAGRPKAASPATGLMSRHKAELAKFLDEALNKKNVKPKNKKKK